MGWSWLLSLTVPYLVCFSAVTASPPPLRSPAWPLSHGCLSWYFYSSLRVCQKYSLWGHGCNWLGCFSNQTVRSLVLDTESCSLHWVWSWQVPEGRAGIMHCEESLFLSVLFLFEMSVCRVAGSVPVLGLCSLHGPFFDIHGQIRW